MANSTPTTEQFQHFVSNLRESFWGDVYGETRLAWKKFWEADSARQRDRFAVVDAYERNEGKRRDYRNGYYERDFVTVLGTIRLRIARTRGQSFVSFPGVRSQIAHFVAQAIYQAADRKAARVAFRHFQLRWQREYPTMVRQFEKDLPNLLSFFSFPTHLWKQLRTTNIIERCFVEVRRRTRPMVCFVNVQSVDRIIYSIFHRFNLEWKTRTLRLFTQAA